MFHGTALAATTPIVTLKDSQAYANSKDVAAFFGGQHARVLRDIDALVSAGVSSIGEGYYTLPNTGSQQHRRFDMTKDGFTLLVMGFTRPRRSISS